MTYQEIYKMNLEIDEMIKFITETAIKNKNLI